MNAVQRVEKGLDRKGLAIIWKEVSEYVEYTRGLILIEAKDDCDNNSTLGWEKYLEAFDIDGTPLKKTQATRYMNRTRDMISIEGSGLIKRVVPNGTSSLEETESNELLPKKISVYRELKGGNAIQRLRNFEEVQEATGKEAGDVTERDMINYNQAKSNASDEMKKFEEKRALPKPTKKVFTAADEISFESWCIKEHGFNVLEEKPKGSMAVYALKDENVSVLFGRLNEWKSAKKIMAKLCHPDTGGNELAMSMLNDFSSLMKSLDGIKKIVDYEERVEKLKAEYSAPKKIGKNES